MDHFVTLEMTLEVILEVILEVMLLAVRTETQEEDIFFPLGAG